MAVCSIQIWYWKVCLEHLLGHHLGHFWYIIWSHVCGATCISDAGFCGRLCQYLMWHIVFSFYNSQNYSAFYYEEVTAFELSTSKVKTAVSTNWLDFRQKLFPQSLRGEGGVVEKLFGRIPFEQHFSYAEASLNPNTSKLVNISFVCVCEKEK